MDLAAGKAASLTTGDAREFQPAWSPDAFVTWSDRGGQIWRVRADGGAPQQLTRLPAYYRDPVWSPDGTRIVALRAPRLEHTLLPVDTGLSANSDLIWIPAEGGDAHVILPARRATRPHFGPEKDRVYIYTPGGSMSMRYDGTDRRIHLKVVGKVWFQTPETADGAPADDVLISLDGQWALAIVSTQLYVMAVPHMGGEPPKVDVFSSSVPVKKLTDIGADHFAWADGGRTITWAVGASFFRQPLSTVSFESEKKPEEEQSKKADSGSADAAAKEIAKKERRNPSGKRPQWTLRCRGIRRRVRSCCAVPRSSPCTGTRSSKMCYPSGSLERAARALDRFTCHVRSLKSS